MRRVTVPGLVVMALALPLAATPGGAQTGGTGAVLAAELPPDGTMQAPADAAGDAQPGAPAPVSGAAADGTMPEVDLPAPALRILDAADVVLADFLWVARPLVVFADSPANPAFQQQMRYIDEVADELLERDVVVIVDTDPSARSDPRQRLRPRGFSLVLMEKDGTVVQRKPSPWTGREITHAIDRLPLRRQEMLEARPSGR